MLQVKVLTGKIKERKITLARAKASRALTADGWQMLFANPELHPREIVESVDSLVEYAKTSGFTKIFFLSNCDHVFNRIRILRMQGEIDEAEFIQYSLDSTGAVKQDVITVTPDGECSEYPNGFLDEYTNQLLQLFAGVEDRKIKDSGASSSEDSPF